MAKWESGSTGLKKQARVTVTDQVTVQLRDAIISGEFPDGSPLRQDALSERFGVSRIPLREALARLEAEGLVVSSPHKGYVVSALSRDDILELFELRMLLEPALLSAAIPRMTEDDLREAEAILKDYNRVFEDSDVRSWGEHNRRFHLALYAPSGHRRTLEIVNGLLLNTDRYTRLVLTVGAGVDQAKEDHGGILELCRKGLVNQAVALARDHIHRARADLLQLVDRESGCLSGATIAHASKAERLETLAAAEQGAAAP